MASTGIQFSIPSGNNHFFFALQSLDFLYRYFHVCDGSLIPDIMHDLLEGALQYEVKVMLKAMISEDKYFTLGIAQH